MGLSSEEKEACPDLYLTFTGGDNNMPAHKWNGAAAIELYKMIKRIKDCTKGMEWIMSIQALPLQMVYQHQWLLLNTYLVFGEQRSVLRVK